MKHFQYSTMGQGILFSILGWVTENVGKITFKIPHASETSRQLETSRLATSCLEEQQLRHESGREDEKLTTSSSQAPS